jgi:deazaflavin-dependent oxidoreductase (nitroreductase family)
VSDQPASYTDEPLGRLVGSLSRPGPFGELLGRALRLPVLGRWLAAAARAPMRIPAVTTRVTRFHAWLLPRSNGRMRRSWVFAAGQPVLALTTTGRRSGAPRTTAVACFTHGDDLALAGMNLGIERPPGWALNLDSNPEATIDLAGHRIPVKARRAHGEEAEGLWRRWLELQPSAAVFRELAGRDIPVFVLTRR